MTTVSLLQKSNPLKNSELTVVSLTQKSKFQNNFDKFKYDTANDDSTMLVKYDNSLTVLVPDSIF